MPLKPFATELELVELIMRSYADEGPIEVADAVYCYGQEKGNTNSVVMRAAQLLQDGAVHTIAVPTYGDLVKYNWFYYFIRTMLTEHGVPEDKILGIPHPQEFPIAHTHTEAIGLARYAKAVGWKTIYVTALPSHLLRAFTETVAAILRENQYLQAYSAVGAVLPWTEPTMHSQGTISGERFAVIESELKKVLAYYLKGDLVSAREVLDYLNIREGLDERRRRLTIDGEGLVTRID